MSDKQVPLMQALSEYLEKQAMDSQPKVDNAPESGQTGPASTGPRSAENSADVESGIPGNTVDGKAMSPDQEEDTAQKNKAPKADETGVNVPEPKSHADDPGTTHPAQAGTEKYSSSQATIEAHNELLGSIAELLKSAEYEDDEYESMGKDKKDKQNTQIESSEQEKEDNNPDEADNGADKATVMNSTDEVSGEKEAADEATVTIKKAEYDDLQTSNEMLGEILGAWVGQSDLQKVAQAQPQAGQTQDDQFSESQVKQAHEKVAQLTDYASNLGNEVADFVISMHEKQAMDPAALMAGAPAEGGAVPGAEAAGGGEEIPPEELDLLLQALVSQGVNPEELMNLNPEELMPAGPEADAALAGGGAAPEGVVPEGAPAALEAAPEASASAAAEQSSEPEDGAEVPGGEGDNGQASEETGEYEEDPSKDEDDEYESMSKEEKQAAAQELARHIKKAVDQRKQQQQKKKS